MLIRVIVAMTTFAILMSGCSPTSDVVAATGTNNSAGTVTTTTTGITNASTTGITNANTTGIPNASSVSDAVGTTSTTGNSSNFVATTIENMN
jgi:hypothetical protein